MKKLLHGCARCMPPSFIRSISWYGCWRSHCVACRNPLFCAMAAAAVAGFLVLPAGTAVLLLLVALYVVWRHKANIERLIAGTEPRIGRKT